ncbi:alpha/beta hydrolase [Gelidibacter sp. F63206]|uniref:alpha/beta hydrolase n=1 Tax=Gelidibacter sp. F63206 TaxID=2926425 RepID=UPI001FF1A912|nr:alpha/beta hydrolase-fold protein [Gelidibacter sp. F63206]MCK0114418.1 alpha/beta hydrolase-fold protein [Gelidibacter sp. F63206]
MRNNILLFVFIGLLKTSMGYSQDVTIKIGIKDSLDSKILNEKRELIVSLPKDYETSNETYPVLYVLDGLESNLIEAINVTQKLRAKMIIVAIPNTDRDRDMMPLSTPTYEVAHPGAENFLSFIGNELIPHIEKNYRSNGIRTIRGRSLSGLFVIYAFLEKPEFFNNYIGNSAGWYADMNPYFGALIDKAFTNKDQFNGKALFVANSLVDPFDPKKEVHHEMLDFSKKVESILGDRLSFKYVTYDHYGHVPYPSFYDGLKYILNLSSKM